MDLAESYANQGYVVVKDLFSPVEIESLSQIIDRIYQQWRDENQSELLEHQLVNMHTLTSRHYFQTNPTERLALFQALSTDKLTEAVNGLFGDGLYFHNTQLFFNPPDYSKQPYWHRDMQYSPITDDQQAAEQTQMLALHVRIPLIQETGIELIPGSHKRWDSDTEKNVRFELNGHKNSAALPGSELIQLQLGDILIFNAQMLHRGNYHLNPARKALDLCLGKPHRFTTAFMDANALPDADELAQIVNKHWYEAAIGISSIGKKP